MEKNEYNNKKYIIFSVEELYKVNFNIVYETSQYTIRKSIDEKKVFIKFDENIYPLFIDTLETKEGPYTHEEMLDILATEEWSGPYIDSYNINNSSNL